jgi:hypothetical protein
MANRLETGKPAITSLGKTELNKCMIINGGMKYMMNVNLDYG